MKARFLIPIAVFLAMAVFLYIGLSRDPRYVPSPLIGKPVPAFELPTLYDDQVHLTQSIFNGQVSLVNVWASWCVSCRYEHALLMDIAKQGDVPIIGINYKDERPDALKWLKDRGDPYRQIVYDYDGRAAIDWGVYGTPETFVVDGQGVIRHKHVGPLDADDWQQELLPLIQSLRQG